LAGVFVYATLRDRPRRGQSPSSPDDPDLQDDSSSHEDATDVPSTHK